MYPFPIRVGKEVMDHIFVHELMTTNVTCVAPQTNLVDVANIMRECHYSCVVVVEWDSPVGIITERDLVKVLTILLESQLPHAMTVADFMSAPPICLPPSASLYEALVVTQARGIRHIPIVDERNRLIGLITQTDIAQAHFRATEKYRESVEQDIRNRTHELAKANTELQALALQDSLLAIGNRRAMEVDVHVTHINAQRYSHPYAIGLLDVDHFKRYNDCYGHPAGDEALKTICGSVKQSIRCGDRLYRFGGEELLVLMPETTLFEAVEAMHRVVENIELENIEHKKSEFGHVTVSAGVAALIHNENEDWENLVDQADKYLYQAKHFGRNQVCWDAGDAGVRMAVNSISAH